MAKSHGKKATLRRKTVPALGAGVRCVARRAGILAPSPPPGKKSFDPASVDRMPPFTRKIFPTGKCGRGRCGGAAGLARVLRGCSEGYAGLCRATCCRLTLYPSGPAAQPAGLPAEIRMISVSELDTGRLAASKACVPTQGIDVDALGGRFRRCAGWECRPARAFLSPGAGGHRRHPADLRSTSRR